MKIRQGFVSNSSSTSYVVMLPKDFDTANMTKENVDMDNLNRYGRDDSDLISIEDVRRSVDGLIKKSSYSHWDDETNGLWICSEVLEKFIVAEISGGPEDGKIVLANSDKVEKIMSGEISL